MSNYKRFYNNSYKYIFVTIVTYNRKKILLQNIEILRKSFIYAKTKYSFDIFSCAILKDHFHMIIKLEKNKDYSEIIRLIKYYFSLHININTQPSNSKIRKREKGIWQRRFWEHTIRDEKDLYKHIDYIHYNSYKHYKIAPKDWEYSTFSKFVKNDFYDIDWCNFNDIHQINNLDFE